MQGQQHAGAAVSQRAQAVHDPVGVGRVLSDEGLVGQQQAWLMRRDGHQVEATFLAVGKGERVNVTQGEQVDVAEEGRDGGCGRGSGC